MQKIKVLVVAASVTMHKEISNLIAEDSSIEVIGAARNATEAFCMVQELRPDVVVLDLEMPSLNGLAALTNIMKGRPTPLLILSSYTKDGITATLSALHNGAVDFITKPIKASTRTLSIMKDKLVFAIKQAAQIPLRTIILNNLTVSKVNSEQKKQRDYKNEGSEALDQIVAVGCGMGGPKALEIVITALPASFPYPLLVAQHMPPKYTKALADRLHRFSNVQVVEAKDNQLVLGGTVYIAPGHCHMTVVQLKQEIRIKLQKVARVNRQTPSIERLFESISRLKDIKKHLILMSGMGNDGAKGMLSAKQAGAQSTIVESQETSIAYDLPHAAIALGCVDYEVPSHLLASKIMKVTGAL